jgi:hypothetical protein
MTLEPIKTRYLGHTQLPQDLSAAEVAILFALDGLLGTMVPRVTLMDFRFVSV